MKFARFIVKKRLLILILTVLLMIPAVLGFLKTRVNYDILTYLPSEIETMKGQRELSEDFGMGAYGFIIIEDMPKKDVAKLKQKISEIEHVDSVLWYDSIMDLSIPMEILPDNIYSMFQTDHCTMMAVLFDSMTSDDVTLEAVRNIRKLCNSQCYVTGMTAFVLDLKVLCEKEEVIYTVLAIAFGLVAWTLFLDSWLIPIIFLLSIGAMILFNMGSNYFFGEISFITEALSACLQLAVTMDYSIFLWHSYNEQKSIYGDKEEAMVYAINKTLTSVIGSSVTTIAGFIALCFMTFTLGKDLGIVMAKGVAFGVIGCVTLLPALILVLDNALTRTKHKSLIGETKKVAEKLVKNSAIFIIIFLLLIVPSYYGYNQANKEVYHDMSNALPEDIECLQATRKLREEFGLSSSHFVIFSSDVSSKDVKNMIKQMNQVDGVLRVLGTDSLIGSRIPNEIVPNEITSLLKSSRYQVLLVDSKYINSSDEVNNQLDNLLGILRQYDEKGKIIGEAAAIKDMTVMTDKDFAVVNIISIIAIFVIILLVEKSLTIPVILISVIELGIFINLGIPHYMGQTMAFITPICISTIQLGATVDYAILMTTRYKAERMAGEGRKTAISIALATSIPSIVVSSMGLFAATFGIAIYSDIEIISSMCLLMARGALISMILVILILPALLRAFDGLIIKTTIGMTDLEGSDHE